MTSVLGPYANLGKRRVCVASIMRLVTLFSEVETDLSWNLSTVAIWSVVELNLAIVSGKNSAFQPHFIHRKPTPLLASLLVLHAKEQNTQKENS